ncbi:Imm52 family immunity protein [Streptomyces sp. NPDC014006]|uniref:Imm52 family immunity protein n=1 Tax=Streptomyces sp. NPDC014006 TaxID=3364870 RepID=UPI0036FB1769
MSRVVRGFWGPREESAEALADRWKQTLDRLSSLLPALAPESGEGWTWQQIHPSGPATALRADAGSILAALRSVQAEDGWSDRTGYRLSLVIGGESGWRADVRGAAGGASEFVPQNLIMEIDAPDGAAVPEAELLTLVAETWQPDFGDVTDDDVLDALEDEADFGPGEPSVGRLGYLSPARAALVPADLPDVTRTELPTGGLLLAVAPPAAETDKVVQANVRLREAGALQPLPKPMDRSVW